MTKLKLDKRSVGLAVILAILGMMLQQKLCETRVEYSAFDNGVSLGMFFAGLVVLAAGAAFISKTYWGILPMFVGAILMVLAAFTDIFG